MRSSKLFISNLKDDVISEQLEALFSNYGEIKESKRDENAGYAIIETCKQTSAESAKKELRGIKIKGYFLKVREASSRKRKRKKFYRRY